MSKPDPLEKYRFKRDAQGLDSTVYAAYSLTKEPQRHLEIRLKFPEPAEAPSFAYLRDITCEWRYGASVGLLFTHPMQVVIRGRNLAELFRALKNHTVEWIQEFDPEEWSREPNDQVQPVITSITISYTKPETPPPPEQRH